MNKLVKLVVLGFVVVGISACGKTGELTPVKAEKQVVVEVVEETPATLPKADIDAAYCYNGDCSVTQTDIMPHSSK